MNILNSILNFFYPPQCDVCGRLLTEGEQVICMACFLDLPRTNFHLDEANAMARLFWGRVFITHAAGYFYYNKGSLYQKLIHKLKYNGRADIGRMLGRYYADELSRSVFAEAGVVMPVPLHPRKERLRGYNQSEIIASGICERLSLPLVTGNLVRNTFTDTQTKRSRFDRYKNMEGMFGLTDEGSVKGLHVLLVDDVVTTGSTLEACAQVLLDAGSGAVSVLTLAVA
ncbi:MAG TPA: ComF family protein [Bacteroidales bacterium]|nr:ComF family protein [Bacteroidales bacterium]